MTFQQPTARLRPFRPIQFGRYTLLGQIGAGGMGEVFLARLEGAQGFEKLCVIKKILPGLVEEGDFLNRFVSEARILVRLAHGSIAQVLDVGQHEGAPYIALEYVDGKDLRKVAARMRERGLPPPLTFVLFVMGRVLDALAYAHRKRDDDDRELNLVHRDISPQNILVSYEGEVKIIDFGLAKSTLSTSRTNPSIVLGKFLYMSPEQARQQPVDRRSDLYSVGLCMYELIVGKNPFDDVPAGELMSHVTEPHVPPLQQVDPLCPGAVSAMVMKALAVDPSERFQTAEEFRARVAAVLLEIDPSAGPESVSRFMRESFSGEYQAERRLLASLKEAAKTAAVQKNEETGVFARDPSAETVARRPMTGRYQAVPRPIVTLPELKEPSRTSSTETTAVAPTPMGPPEDATAVELGPGAPQPQQPAVPASATSGPRGVAAPPVVPAPATGGPRPVPSQAMMPAPAVSGPRPMPPQAVSALDLVSGPRQVPAPSGPRPMTVPGASGPRAVPPTGASGPRPAPAPAVSGPRVVISASTTGPRVMPVQVGSPPDADADTHPRVLIGKMLDEPAAPTNPENDAVRSSESPTDETRVEARAPERRPAEPRGQVLKSGPRLQSEVRAAEARAGTEPRGQVAKSGPRLQAEVPLDEEGVPDTRPALASPQPRAAIATDPIITSPGLIADLPSSEGAAGQAETDAAAPIVEEPAPAPKAEAPSSNKPLVWRVVVAALVLLPILGAMILFGLGGGTEAPQPPAPKQDQGATVTPPPAPERAPAPQDAAPAPEQPPAAGAAGAAEPPPDKKAELESIELEGGDLDPAPLGATAGHAAADNAAAAPADASQTRKKRKRDPELNREWRKLKAVYDEASHVRACQKRGITYLCDTYHLLRSDIFKADASDPEKTRQLLDRVRTLSGEFESSRSRW
ncbi:MAG TPA: protein kinase [Longimicrobium sp.]|nr:protein kinase [Longimicrobium sp.]